MGDQGQLVAIEGRMIGDLLVIPKGLTPKFAHKLESQRKGTMVVHVTDWSDAKEFEQRYYIAYALGDALKFNLTVNGEVFPQEWFRSFEPMKEGLRQDDSFTLRELTSAAG